MIKLNRPICPNPEKLSTNYKYPENKAVIRNACHDKCMYCESKISHTYYGDVEHIRPKATFPHLEFVWDNLGYVCAQCNGEKANKWNSERSFVNPFDDYPSQYLAPVGAYIFHRNGSERGEYTWREIGLNRPALLEQRQDRINQLRNLIDKVERTGNEAIKSAVFTELSDFVGENNAYSMVTTAVLSVLRNDQPPDS